MDVAVQQLVDGLALRLHRPAVLEDNSLRLLTYSAHDEIADEVREASILRRHASADVSRWLGSVGIRNARGPVRVPGNADLRMLPRICFPVRHHDLLLGYVWFVDADESVEPADIEWCVQEIGELGALLHRTSIADLSSSERVTEAIRSLLSDSPASATAAEGLVDDGLFGADDGVIAAVLQIVADSEAAAATAQDALADTLFGSPHLYRRGSGLHLTRKDHSVLLFTTGGADDARLWAQLESLHAVATAGLETVTRGASLVIGVGERSPELVRAADSYGQARLAAMAAAALTIGPVVYWSDLGVYQAAANLATRTAYGPTLHDGLHDLLESPEALPLLETLETYLDTAGNAQLTAEMLHLHRTSLYYRLQRVEHLAHTDLKDGMERLALHLTLKVARLTGQYTPRHRMHPPSRAA